MKKGYFLGILFFSALWGASEAVLGGIFYRAHLPHASVPLTVIAFIILSIARVYLPQKGSSTLIASIAMLYKFVNTPFFACHLLAIFCLGLSFDLVFGFSRFKNKAVSGLIATYLGYIIFALTITYVFRYRYWIAEGISKIVRHVGISGTMASVANAVLVPYAFSLGKILKERTTNLFKLKPAFAGGSLLLITAGLWIMGVVRCF